MKITYSLVNPPCVSYSITYLTDSSVSESAETNVLLSVTTVIKVETKSFCEVIGICGKIGFGYIVL